MRVKLQLVICHGDGHEETVTDVMTLKKNHQRTEHLGVTLAESKHLLSTLQRHLLYSKLTPFSTRMRRARTAAYLSSSRPAVGARFAHCWAPLGQPFQGVDVLE